MKRSVTIIGWSTIVCSGLIILSDLFSLLLADSMNQLNPFLNSFPQFKTGAMQSLVEISEYSRIWSMYTIGYFVVTMVGGVQFVRFRNIGRKILEIACWIGFCNACIDSYMSYSLWSAMHASLKNLVGTIGLPLEELNPLGIGMIIAGFFLWVLPSSGLIVYFRRPALKALMH